MERERAQALVEAIRREIAPVEEKLIAHPYLRALEAGELPREALRAFAGEQYFIIGSDLRSVAHLVSRFGGTPARDYFLGTLAGEQAAFAALLTFARALGMDEAALAAYEPLPGPTPTPATWRGWPCTDRRRRWRPPTSSTSRPGARAAAA